MKHTFQQIPMGYHETSDQPTQKRIPSPCDVNNATGLAFGEIRLDPLAWCIYGKLHVGTKRTAPYDDRTGPEIQEGIRSLLN